MNFKINKVILWLISIVFLWSCAVQKPGKLKSIQELGSVTKYHDLNDALQNPQNVYWLNLENDNLEQIPTEIGRFKKLQVLFLGFNQIKSIPDFIYELPNLQRLYIRNNQITEISGKIAQLSNLEILDLNNNKVTSLPASKYRCRLLI
jgi:Leucine-rich repeat (LRR) protein